MSKKRISQETFDEVVRENMEDFDQPLKDALQDAIKQFVKQGVDLTNIDITGGIGRQEIIDAITLLNDSLKTTRSSTKVAAIKCVSELCRKDHEFCKRNQMLFVERGGLNNLHLLLVASEIPEVLLETVVFLTDLSKNNVEIRDFFEPGGSVKLCQILSKYAMEQLNFDIAMSSLLLARAVAKTENNKSTLMKSGLGTILSELIIKLYNMEKSEQTSTVLLECCQLLRGMCVHDDLRKDMSCAYDNGKFFLKQNNLIEIMMKISFDFKLQLVLASSSLLAIRNLITTEESVQVISQYGAIELILSILKFSDSPMNLVKSALGVTRNLCADDLRKNTLMSENIVDLIVNIMNQDRYNGDSNLIEHSLACLAALSLRSPSNSQRIVSCGNAIEIISKLMRKYSNYSSLQRQGCLVIRNIAGRCPDLRNILLDASLEPILRDAGKLSDCVDEAYAALRDLGCEVQYVKVSADGKIEAAYEQFGGNNKKLQFNPVYDETDVIQQRMQEEARAPFSKDNVFRDYSSYHHNDDDDDNETHHHHSQDHTHSNNNNSSSNDHSHEHSHGHNHDDCCSGNNNSVDHDHSHKH